MTDEVLVRAEHICKYCKIGGGRMLHAVEDVNLDIHRGETLGLVGESGCGKSTLGRTLMGIYQPTKGKLIYDGKPVDLSNKKDRWARPAHDRRLDHRRGHDYPQHVRREAPSGARG